MGNENQRERWEPPTGTDEKPLAEQDVVPGGIYLIATVAILATGVGLLQTFDTIANSGIVSAVLVTVGTIEIVAMIGLVRGSSTAWTLVVVMYAFSTLANVLAFGLLWGVVPGLVTAYVYSKRRYFVSPFDDTSPDRRR
jgi:hypothetical protein